jgi:DNA-binding response OmpR family regulator
MEGMMSKTTLLAIDDDQDILKVLKANLELHGFTLFTADSLAAARTILAERRPDLVLLDLMLPDGDGLEFCCALKSLYPHLPVIMLTAKDKISDKVIGFELGADDYMVKPFETRELMARIRARLRPITLPSQASILTAGDLSLDLRNQIVTVQGAVVSLTPKEFQLLSCLMENRNNLVSREDIRQRLWSDTKLYAWSRVIDVHIQHLRQKIEINQAEPRHIITVPGRGYRFEDDENDAEKSP